MAARISDEDFEEIAAFDVERTGMYKFRIISSLLSVPNFIYNLLSV